ncbi:hypothetical protein [Spirochaeta cellobiosiphila]|uniref:hypothetical protein n=1 Tax=Spirochaeta cellobiosiphila TaxID=504483 RepID=UPI0004094834|nr:hypothetical protein [Spirochaeta cellobiosiphila]
MTIYGIDEAALGPILGPYTAAVSGFTTEGTIPLREILKDIWFDTAPKDPLCLVCDSKKLYSPDKGIEELEQTVLCFFYLLMGRLPDSFNDFLLHLGSTTYESIPWLHNDIKLPLHENNEHLMERAQKLSVYLQSLNVHLKQIKLQFVPALTFNQTLQKYPNKGRTTQILLSPLFPKVHKDITIIIDKQGGRRFYGDWLLELYPHQSIRAFQEGQLRSSYEVGQANITFEQKADDQFFATALSSLFAKYAREVAMHQFNHYWQNHYPHLQKTAGYPQDGKRFIKELSEYQNIEEILPILVRAK